MNDRRDYSFDHKQTTNLQGIEITLQRDNLLTSLECLESKTRDQKKATKTRET